MPNYAAVAAPLSDATRKGMPNQVKWSDAMDMSFNSLKQCMSEAPVLRLPDPTKEYVVRTDASNIGLGAALMQEHEGVLHPVAYLSRKLLPREQNYSAVERECLGIVWAIEKLQAYLYGREFVLESDHQPLAYMHQAKLKNAKVMRWAIFLQPYRFRLRAIKGRDNLVADYLSRSV